MVWNKKIKNIFELNVFYSSHYQCFIELKTKLLFQKQKPEVSFIPYKWKYKLYDW
jgi:hypothetical protein